MSATPRTDALVANPRESINTSLRLHHAVSLARTLERENTRLRETLRGIVERLNFELQS
jgi:hypothetical protein